MKKLWVILIAGFTLVMSQGFREVTADKDSADIFDSGGRIPLSALAGTYSDTIHGSLFFCVEDTAPFPPARCGSQGSIGVPLSVLVVGAVTGDDKGNLCGTLTETVSDLPVDISPPAVVVFHNISKVTSYDSTTGTGDASFTNYIGGHCHGARFDSTGATVASTGTSHFAASNRGKRIDYVVTSLTDPVGAIGDFSISSTTLRH